MIREAFAPGLLEGISTRRDVDALFDHLTRFGIKLGLDSIGQLLAHAAHPERSFPSVHVAGTNGKGSTVAFLSALLGADGRRVGAFTSPHLTDFSERIQIAGRPISNDALVSGLGRLYPCICEMDPAPTFFEVSTALAFLYFSGMNGMSPVDAAVVEVGMGGRFDATNVIAPKVSVITNVTLDHTAYLGRTVPDVALEKAGIIKPGVPVVTAARGAALSVIRERAAALSAPLYVLGHDFTMSAAPPFTYRGIRHSCDGIALGLLGQHQRENAALALAAFELFDQDQPPWRASLVQAGLSATRWPGRMEIVRREPLVMLDGAHNPAGAKALAASLPDLGGGPLWLVLGVLADKSFRGILNPLAPLASHLILTAPQSDRKGDLRTQARAVRNAVPRVSVVPSVADAVETAIKGAAADGGWVCVAGSLYTVGEARTHLVPGGRDA